MMGSKNRSKQPAGSGGGSRTLTYVLVAIVAVLVTYYFIVPAFTPRAPTGPVGTGGASVSLNPSTDIQGTFVTLDGQKLAANQTVAAKFGTTSLNLSGTCRTNSAGDLAGCTFWVPQAAKSGTSYNVTVLAGSAPAVSTKFTIPQYTPPVSTLLVTLTSVALGFVTQLVTRRVVDLSKERKMKAEVNAFNKEKREATAANDKAKLDKLKKRELQVRQDQAKLSTARFKVTAITFVPLLGVYYLMATFLGGYGVIVAFTPIPIPLFAGASQSGFVFEVSLFWWYFLSSFTFSTMLTRLLHTTT